MRGHQHLIIIHRWLILLCFYSFFCMMLFMSLFIWRTGEFKNCFMFPLMLCFLVFLVFMLWTLLFFSKNFATFPSFVTMWVLSQFKFCHNSFVLQFLFCNHLCFVTIKLKARFKFCHNEHLSQFVFLTNYVL